MTRLFSLFTCSFLLVVLVVLLVPQTATAQANSCDPKARGAGCQTFEYCKALNDQSGQGECACRWGAFETVWPGGPLGTDICDFMRGYYDPTRPRHERLDARGAFGELLNLVAATVIALVVIAATLGIVIGGYIYMTSGGSAARVQLAKVWVGSALLAIVIALTAWVLLSIIGQSFV